MTKSIEISNATESLDSYYQVPAEYLSENSSKEDKAIYEKVKLQLSRYTKHEQAGFAIQYL